LNPPCARPHPVQNVECYEYGETFSSSASGECSSKPELPAFFRNVWGQRNNPVGFGLQRPNADNEIRQLMQVSVPEPAVEGSPG
jgi:hypothetical protein